jgi:hypothetical protein
VTGGRFAANCANSDMSFFTSPMRFWKQEMHDCALRNGVVYLKPGQVHLNRLQKINQEFVMS